MATKRGKAVVTEHSPETVEALQEKLAELSREYDRLRSCSNIIEEAKKVANATGELRYRGHLIPAVQSARIGPALNIVLAVRVMQLLEEVMALPARLELIVQQQIAEAIPGIAEAVGKALGQGGQAADTAKIKAEGTD